MLLRFGVADSVVAAAVALHLIGAVAVVEDRGAESPRARRSAGSDVSRTPAPSPPLYGARPNLDLPGAANLGVPIGLHLVRPAASPGSAALDRAAVALARDLCGDADVRLLVVRSVNTGLQHAHVVVAVRSRGVPVKERPEHGSVAAELVFRGDGYAYDVVRRQGVCATGG